MPNAPLRWLDRSQPQTLMSATILLYINAAFGLLYGQLWSLYYGFPLGAVLVIGQLASGIGIANEKKWGYWLGVGLVAVWIAFLIHYFAFVSIINLLFYIALLALLLHPMSRSYRRTWFR